MKFTLIAYLISVQTYPWGSASYRYNLNTLVNQAESPDETLRLNSAY